MPSIAGFRQSPFRSDKISVLCCRIRLSPFTISHGCSIASIARLYKMEIQPPQSHALHLFSHDGPHVPKLWLSFTQFSIYPHTQIFIPAHGVLLRVLLYDVCPFPSETATCYTPLQVSLSK